MAESGDPADADIADKGEADSRSAEPRPDSGNHSLNMDDAAGCQSTKPTDMQIQCDSGDNGTEQTVMESDPRKSDNDEEFQDALEGCMARVGLKKDDSGIEITEKSPSVQSDNDLSGTDLSEPREAAREDEAEEEVAAVVAARIEARDERVKRRRRALSSSDSETDDVSTVRPGSGSESEDEVDLEPVVGEPVLRQMYRDILLRESGFPSRVSPLTFPETISGNLALVQRLELQYKLDHHTGCVNALHYSQNGNLLASGSDDLKVVIWDWSHQKVAIVFDSGHRNNVFQAKFLPFSGDCHVVTCARDGQVRLAELSTTGVCKQTKKLAQHKGAAHKLALELDSPHVFLSCGEDAATFQIDLREGKPNKLLVTKENDQKVPIYSIHSNPSNGYQFCLAGRDRYVRLYDKRKLSDDQENATLKKFCPQHMAGAEDSKCNVTCAVYSYDGTEVLGSYNDEDIYLFDTSHSDGADYIKRYHGHRNNATVKGVNFYGPRSEYVVSGSDCGNVYLWDKQAEKVVQFFTGDEGGVVNVLEPHPYGPYLATSGLDSDVKIWAPTAPEPNDMEDLHTTMRKNRKERRAERLNEPDMLDGQAIWLLMQHLRRSVRRRQEAEGEGEGAGEGEGDSDDESISNSDSDDAGVDQCNPS